MIDLHYWTTPNGWKIPIMLEEVGLPYRPLAVDLGKGAQKERAFLAINPNGRIPAIVDHDPLGGGSPVTVFESGAILLYLAEKSGKLMPKEPRGRYEVTEWVFWQTANLGPMAGQAHHFLALAPEKIPYAIQRFTEETVRLSAVLDERLADREHIAGEYSIADIAAWPWVVGVAKALPGFAAKFPNVDRWLAAVGSRPAVQKGFALRP